MAYTKTNWTSTTPINITNLNKLENGTEENSSNISDLNVSIGDLSTLATSDKTNLVKAINEVVETCNDKEVEVYSSNETLIGSWLGKPLYRKVIESTGGLSSSNPLTISVNVENLDLLFVENAFMFNNNNTIASGNRICYPLPFNTAPSENTKIELRLNLDNVELTASGSWNNMWTKIVVVNYTKTTDEVNLQ